MVLTLIHYSSTKLQAQLSGGKMNGGGGASIDVFEAVLQIEERDNHGQLISFSNQK